MKVHDYDPLLNNTYADAPIVRSQKPTSRERKHHSSDLTPASKRAPFNMSPWTLLPIYPKARTTIASSRSSTRDVQRPPNSSPATKRSTDQESHDSTSRIWSPCLAYPKESSQTEIHGLPVNSLHTSVRP